MLLPLPLTRKLFIRVILRRHGSALYVERLKHGGSWQFHGTVFRALSTNLFLYWMLPPVSRVCFHYYFNFVLAERRCQIMPFKRNASFGGPLESLYFWLSVPQHIWGTYWFPQTILHAVLTLLLEGPKAHFLWGAVPPGSSEPALKGRSTVGRSIVSTIDATMGCTPGHAVCHISLATQIQWTNDTEDSSTHTWNKHLSFPSLNINSLQSGITWTDICRQTILHVFCIALFKMCIYLFLPMFQSLLIVTAIRLSQQTFLLL